MGNITQRLGLVAHWAGFLVTVLFLLYALLINATYLENRWSTEVVVNYSEECDRTVAADSNQTKVGDCWQMNVCEDGYYGAEKCEFYTLKPYFRGFNRFIDEFLIRTLLEYFYITLSFLTGWVIRFILVSKVHILPWKK